MRCFGVPAIVVPHPPRRVSLRSVSLLLLACAIAPRPARADPITVTYDVQLVERFSRQGTAPGVLQPFTQAFTLAMTFDLAASGGERHLWPADLLGRAAGRSTAACRRRASECRVDHPHRARLGRVLRAGGRGRVRKRLDRRQLCRLQRHHAAHRRAPEQHAAAADRAGDVSRASDVFQLRCVPRRGPLRPRR
jgi:hypothetical protein